MDVQGEVVEQQFGEKEVCFRTLDLYTSAVLEASLNPTTAPKPEWRQAMDTMSKVLPSQTTCLCTVPSGIAICNFACPASLRLLSNVDMV